MTSHMALQSSLLLNAVIPGPGCHLGFTDRPERGNILGKWEKGTVGGKREARRGRERGRRKSEEKEKARKHRVGSRTEVCPSAL